MLARFKTARLLWPLIMTVIEPASWWGSARGKLQRKAWKEELIRTIEARIHAATPTGRWYSRCARRNCF